MLTAALLATCGLVGRAAALMERIVAAESAGSALAINLNSREEDLVRQPRDVEEAVAMARWLLLHGYNFDAGIAQVNSSNFQRLGLSPENLFYPCTNLRAGAKVLDECLLLARARLGEGPQAEQGALSCYNTGSLSRGVRNGYVAAVQRTADKAGHRATSADGAPDHREQASGTETSDLEVLGRRVADVFAAARSR
jgi:type IV secretion system protein VirB1